MQTFLPYPDFGESVRCLDYRRLGKQRVEAKQLLNVLLGEAKGDGWKNHPACKMWRNRHEALALYMNYCINEWISRGYNNTMQLWTNWTEPTIIMPVWFGDESFHASHRSNLLRKDSVYYGYVYSVTEEDGTVTHFRTTGWYASHYGAHVDVWNIELVEKVPVQTYEWKKV